LLQILSRQGVNLSFGKVQAGEKLRIKDNVRGSDLWIWVFTIPLAGKREEKAYKNKDISEG